MTFVVFSLGLGVTKIYEKYSNTISVTSIINSK